MHYNRLSGNRLSGDRLLDRPGSKLAKWLILLSMLSKFKIPYLAAYPAEKILKILILLRKSSILSRVFVK